MRNMYPRVKVRAYEQEVCLSPGDVRKTEFFSRIATDSPSVQPKAGSASAEKEIEISSPPSTARIMKTYLQASISIPLTSPSKGAMETKNRVAKDNNTKPIVSSRACNYVSRPRAVLSSPDNDGVIGNRNKLIRERGSTLEVRNARDRISVRPRLAPNDDIVESDTTLKNKMAKGSEKAFKNIKFREPAASSQKTRPGILGNQV